MRLLRFTQNALDDDRYRVEISLEGDGLARQSVHADFSFALTPQDEGDLRWYLEDYLEWPHDPAPRIAARVEERVREIGTELFRDIFHANDDARDLWATLRTGLPDTRVEVVTGVREATAIPWELLRDPKTDAPLALRCRAFVRAQPDAVQHPALPGSAPEAIRILLVICRPGGRDDVPFRSVAARILKSLGGAAHEGQAVALGRKQLHAKPLREVVADPLPLQDWQVPIVYEAAPIRLFPEPADGGKLEISVGDASIASAGGLDPNLPPDPDAGCWGRDETLLALDRAFDDQPIVLLHAYAGSGKTATAAEFARWYAPTGGVEGPVLFTSSSTACHCRGSCAVSVRSSDRCSSARASTGWRSPTKPNGAGLSVPGVCRTPWSTHKPPCLASRIVASPRRTWIKGRVS